MPAPGPFLWSAGIAGVSVFIAVHLLYGAVMGALADGIVGVRAGVPRRSRVFHTSSPPRPAREITAH